jgi:hypothetical protein
MLHTDEYRVCKGNFVGIVRPYGSQYEYFLQDMRRDKLLIHGCGVDFAHATIAITELLDALMGEP